MDLKSAGGIYKCKIPPFYSNTKLKINLLVFSSCIISLVYPAGEWASSRGIHFKPLIPISIRNGNFISWTPTQ